MFHIHNNEYNNSVWKAFLDKTAFLQYKDRERKMVKENLCSLIKTTLKQGWSRNHCLSVVRVIKTRILPLGISYNAYNSKKIIWS